MVHFGLAHAERYLAGLEGAIRHLLDFPESAPQLHELNGAIRLMRYKSHYVLYHIESDQLVLVRVLHIRQDIARYLRP